MKFENSLSPDSFNLLVLAAGLFGSFIIYQLIDGRTAQLRYEPVYGEVSAHAGELVSVQRLQALPLVEARSESPADGISRLNDQAIEAAFREPIFAVPTEPEPEPEVADVIVEEPVQVGLDSRFLMTYRPLIGGINGQGAVVNGVFWKSGEKITLMPVHDVTSNQVHYPVLKRVNNSSVVFSLAGKDVKVEFERF